MRLSVHTFLSLDGVMQGPGGRDEDTSGGFTRGGWVVPFGEDEVFERVVGGEWFAAAEEILLGRTTFEMMRGYWPQVTDPDNRVATVLNTHPKHVVSTALDEADAGWGDTSVIPGDVEEHVRALKERPGGELQVHGSRRLARTLHRAGLVDVFRLLVFPVVVGQGKRLFDESSLPGGFRVESGFVSGGGVVALSLVPDPSVDLGTRDEFRVVDGRETIG
ncbi:dihydrofolate reductase family protein [Nocardiopsis sp. NRRL B-16309]|uniref:dihydrofolate reductase family protein n=1 Tax=Nocardiopsis sp. NRRL B-16309 TaxID=1519494 RepID=UPI0006ADC820|nr:dihydrofolate reductase family protein [Nocardiopsis sp. NRRL B-16309]KOX15207.1 deaminase/reductase [Nocardiopsis sp. NRRL B-16309]